MTRRAHRPEKPFPTEALLDWYDVHRREPPWGDAPTPYRVWVGLVMFHQTRMETAIPYYRRFLERFPSPLALAAADLEEVLRVWEGLGYYRRARYLHQAAQRIMREHGGRLPDDWEALRALPGIGDYTAGAILSIAFGRDHPAVDGNTARVLTRWLRLESPIGSAQSKRECTHQVRRLIPAGRAAAFNQALMDLGALVCQPRTPQCPVCPVREGCETYRLGLQDALPRRASRRSLPHHQVAAAVLVRDGQVLIAQRRADDMLGGLWEFPGGRQEEGESLPECLRREIREELGLRIRVGQPLLSLDHAYTHFRMTLHAFWCTLEDESQNPRCLECADWRWVQPGQLGEYPLSTADRKIADTLQDFNSPGEPPGSLDALAHSILRTEGAG